MKCKTIALLLSIFFAFSVSVSAEVTLKIGYVNMNKAINESDEGRRSKNFLESQFKETKKELDQKKMVIQSKERELSESLMLSEAAKKEKREEIEQLKRELAQEAKQVQNQMRQDESRHTQKILKDLVSIVKSVAQAEDYDAIIEYNIRQTIIYSKHDITDITDKVILEYNKRQNTQ
mgnify:CR=1 FL=1